MTGAIQSADFVIVGSPVRPGMTQKAGDDVYSMSIL